MRKKKRIFDSDVEKPTDYDDYDPVGGLAYTDFSKPAPILEGEDAERFIRMMEENERKAAENAKRPMTVEEAKESLSFRKMIYEYEKRELEEKEQEIKELEDFINKNS
jgi:DNA repair exonuclease SbcCD ATPase subunit